MDYVRELNSSVLEIFSNHAFSWFIQDFMGLWYNAFGNKLKCLFLQFRPRNANVRKDDFSPWRQYFHT